MLFELLREIDSPITRQATDAAEFAEGVREVGKDTGAAVLDVWSAFMVRAGWTAGDSALPGSKQLGKNDVLAELLCDGKSL